MEFPLSVKNPLYAWVIFFSTVVVLSIGYALSNTWTPMSDVSSGNPLTAMGWNNLQSNVGYLSGQIAGLIAGGWSPWTAVTGGIGYSAGKVLVWSPTGTNAELNIQSGTKSKWGIYHDAISEDLRFWNGSNRVTFSSGGNVGIGTTSPIWPLQINSTIGLTGGGLTVNTFQGPSIQRFFRNNGTDSASSPLVSGDTISALNFGGYWSWKADPVFISGDARAGISTIATENWSSSTNNGTAISFNTTMNWSFNMVEQMRINHNGNVGIGTVSPSQKLEVMGTVLADAHTTHSDIRYKKDVTTLSGSLDRIMEIRGVRFLWKDPSKGTGSQLGVIAQEVEKEFPEIVNTNQDGYKSVAYDKLVAPLIEAMKELSHKIDTLFVKYVDQQKEIKSLTKRMEAIEAISAR